MSVFIFPLWMETRIPGKCHFPLTYAVRKTAVTSVIIISRHWSQDKRLWWDYGLPCCLRWERICLQSERPGFDPWVGKIPWKRAWAPTTGFLPGESPWAEQSGGLQSMGSQRIGHDWATKHTHTTTSGLPWWLSGKESTGNARDVGSTPGSGGFPGEENGNLHQ